ncbi:16S rRNA (cytosine(1402)-N(4))-methyltransferase RsmH [Candidatus Woesebacteria bacterium]|nr:16S rRNA (cytosine(1402)-N(4))-methyltransferase RsmH [Candidatus Woesebacteria bacterium]MCD8527467.1 16S rRNA (cytosine(1402)-N(4))-methyltransferase RsmH [Candidatus Woesebacteria bacterium]MCD8546209.1 16S rRNA (cytosine(1402)-N(4))-methyltransferase RsmH [Candidatus Woesebacteria bacterium]
MHKPVMRDEVVNELDVQADKWFIDGTFGRGGHTREILERGGKVVAFDLDHDAIEFGERQFAEELANGHLKLIHGNFAQLSQLLKDAGFQHHDFHGAMFDLGMSSNQIEESERGFTFQEDEPLDMRMNTDFGVTAADLVNALPERHLKSLFWDFAQETSSSAIARRIVQAREEKPFTTTKQLADLIARVKPRKNSKLHPATKVFMALRMAVNMELDNLTVLLDQVLHWIEPSGRLVFMSFHEGEDREVKQRFRAWEKSGRGVQVYKKPLMPSDEEIQENPRARSVKVRVLELL